MKPWKAVFAVWIFFWAFYLVRGLYKGEFAEYKALLRRDREARRSYAVGDGLYRFLNFSLTNLPRSAAYGLEGEFKPIDERRFIYYLYPRMAKDNPDYILCYKVPEGFNVPGFGRLAVLKDTQFILKKKGRR